MGRYMSDAVEFDALAMLELSSVARGYKVLNELLKRAAVSIIDANLTEPSKYVIAFWGPLADVEESMAVAKEEAGALLLSHLLIPYACLLYTSPSPRDATLSRMPSSA